jgi:hypothetical protein
MSSWINENNINVIIKLRYNPKIKYEVYLGEVMPVRASVPSSKPLAVALDRRTRHHRISSRSY